MNVLRWSLFLVTLACCLVSVSALTISTISEKHDLINHEIILEVDTTENLQDIIKTWDFELTGIRSVIVNPRYEVLTTKTIQQPISVPYLIYCDSKQISKVKDPKETDKDFFCWEGDIKNLTKDSKPLFKCKTETDCTQTKFRTETIPKEIQTWEDIGFFDKIKTLNKQTLKLNYNTFKKNSKTLIRITYQTPLTLNWGSQGNWSMNPENWWNESWGYRVNVSLTHNGDYAYPKTFRIDINDALLGAAATTFWDKTQNDGDDVRFASIDGTTQYEMINKYWSDNNAAFFYVELPLVTDGTNEFYMYFGNDAATSDNNTGINQNYIFDDFEDNNYLQNPTWTIGAGTWTTTTVPEHGAYSFATSSNGASASAPVFSYAGNDTNYIFYMKTTVVNGSTNDQVGIQSNASWGTDQRLVITIQSNFHCYSVGGGDSDLGVSPSANTWYKFVIGYTNQSSVGQCYVYDEAGTTLLASKINQTVAAFDVGYFGTYHDAGDTSHADYLQVSIIPLSLDLTFSNLESNQTLFGIDFNVFETGTSNHLTTVNMDCNVDVYDLEEQNSPFSQDFNAGTYYCEFTKDGYDQNNLVFTVDSNATVVVYLAAPPVPVHPAPTVNVVYPNGGEFFNTKLVSSVNITFTVNSQDSNSLLVDLNYSTSNSQGTGDEVLLDENTLGELILCDNYDFTTDTNCIYSWNLSGVSDNNYFILIAVKTDFNVGFDASDSNFQIYFYDPPAAASSSQYNVRYINPESNQRDTNRYFNPESSQNLTEDEKQTLLLNSNNNLIFYIGVILIVFVLIIGVLVWKK